MVIGGCDICPASTAKCPEDANPKNELGQRAVRAAGQDVEEENQSEPGPGSNRNEYLEHSTLRVSIANGGRDGGEPFLRISLESMSSNILNKVSGHVCLRSTRSERSYDNADGSRL